MIGKGAISAAVHHVRTSLESMLSSYNWTLFAADTPFQKLNILATNRSTGFCIVSWKSDVPVSQAGRSLVIRARIAITICAHADLAAPATGKLNGSTPPILEIHDRVKGAMLAMTMPENIAPEPGADVSTYVGSNLLTPPDGIPLDAIEQEWEIELVELFSPENTE